MLDSTVKTRIAIGLFLISLFLSLVYVDHLTGRGLCLGLLIVAIVTTGLHEYAKLSEAAGALTQRKRMMAFGALFCLLPVLEFEFGFHGAVQWESGVIVALFFSLLIPVLGRQPSSLIFIGLGSSMFGFFYVAFLGSFVQKLRFFHESGNQLGPTLMLYVVFIAKGVDVFAFFTGKYLGRTKLIPHISPDKTIAGFVGGMTGALVITSAFAHWTGLGTLLPGRYILPFSMIVGLIVIVGDLVESFLKRSAAIKDSAKLLPTFGGVLDVIDSILAAAPVVYFGLIAIQHLRHDL